MLSNATKFELFPKWKFLFFYFCSYFQFTWITFFSSILHRLKNKHSTLYVTIPLNEIKHKTRDIMKCFVLIWIVVKHVISTIISIRIRRTHRQFVFIKWMFKIWSQYYYNHIGHHKYHSTWALIFWGQILICTLKVWYPYIKFLYFEYRFSYLHPIFYTVYH